MVYYFAYFISYILYILYIIYIIYIFAYFISYMMLLKNGKQNPVFEVPTYSIDIARFIYAKFFLSSQFPKLYHQLTRCVNHRQHIVNFYYLLLAPIDENVHDLQREHLTKLLLAQDCCYKLFA